MGKVEIKIQKKILTPGNLQQYRNYPALLKKYERTKRFKRALRIFIYSIALTMFVLALIFLGMWKVLLDKKHESMNRFAYVSLNDQDTTFIQYLGKTETQSHHTVIIKYDVENIIDSLSLPVNETFNDASMIKFVTLKTCVIDGTNVEISKYALNPGNPTIQSHYYYSPNIGILVFAYSTSPHLGSSSRAQRLLSTGNPEIDKILPRLMHCLTSDTLFYEHRFKKQIP